MGKDNTCNWKCGSGGGSTPMTSPSRQPTPSPSQPTTSPSRPTPSPSQPTPSPSRSPVTQPHVTPTPSSGGQVPAYGQCGGNNYNGPPACVSGYHCNAYSEWYSQCIPDHY
ncbi:hypothetical protein LEN26_008741 [Aphanomyces euteiches]|nr:hypothetical protein AeMF1_005967 [Aphanomyces euteiches]KAH9130213.1 hypothetical protein LEN26_008741 [Aphanomyces euteiches]KAH9182932.1 hypothetical protein AeNC1_015092 [Aphanomyces euteiches]